MTAGPALVREYLSGTSALASFLCQLVPVGLRSVCRRGGWHSYCNQLLRSFVCNGLQVCREFQRGSCSRQPGECRYAHPNENVALDGGDSLVMVCMDYVRNRCSRDSCKYFHPPDHLQSQIRAAAQLQRANGFLPPSASAVAADQTMVRLLLCSLPCTAASSLTRCLSRCLCGLLTICCLVVSRCLLAWRDFYCQCVAFIHDGGH